MKLHKIAHKIAITDQPVLRVDPIDNTSVVLTCRDNTQIFEYTCPIQNNLTSPCFVDPNLFFVVIDDALSFSQEKDWLLVALEHATIKVPYTTLFLEKLELPEHHKKPKEVTKTIKEVFNQIELARHFLPKEMTSSIGGILVDNKEKALVSTNGSILCKQSMQKTFFKGITDEIILDRDAFNGFKNLDYLEAFCSVGEKEISLSGHCPHELDDSTYMSFVYITSLPVYQTYPNYKTLFPENSSYTYSLQKHELEEALSLIKLTKVEHTLIDFHKHIVRDEKSTVVFDVSPLGDTIDLTAAFRTDYLKIVVNGLTDSSIKIDFTAPHEPFIFSDKLTKILVMPLLIDYLHL